MIYVVPFHTDHIHDIMSADDDFGTLFDQQQFLEFTRNTNKYWTAYTGYEDGEVVGVGGLVEIYPHLAEAWRVLKKNRGASLGTTRNILKIWRKLLYSRPKYERIQATVHQEFEEGIRFLDFLGFTNEGLMQKFGPDKSNFFRYAYIRHGPN